MAKQTHLIAADLETTSNKDMPTVYLTGAYFEKTREYKEYKIFADFIKDLNNLDYDAIVYFHNGARFDFHFFLNEFERLGLNQQSPIRHKTEIKEIESSSFFDQNVATTSRQGEKNKLIKPGYYQLMVDKNYKILEIKLGINSIKKNSKNEKNPKGKNRVVLFRDSNLLFAGSIKSYGETLNDYYKTDKYKKGSIDYILKQSFNKTYSYYDKKNNVWKDMDKEKWKNISAYLKQDCRILLQYLKLMDKYLPRKKWKMTVASTFYKEWKRKFAEQEMEELTKLGIVEPVIINKGMTKYRYKGKTKLETNTQLAAKSLKLLQPVKWLNQQSFYNNDLLESQYMYKYYNGGITYANPDYVGILVDNIDVYDINSSYPDSMRNYLLPYGEPSKGDDKEKKLKLIRITAKKKIRITTSLPFLYTINQKQLAKEYKRNINAGDTFYITSPEWEQVKIYYGEKNWITRIEYSFKQTQGKKLFGKYIDEATEGKIKALNEKNPALYYLNKLMQNTLYGKFGTNPEMTSRIWNDTDGEWEKRTIVQESKYYLPIAIFTTAYSRVKLVKAVGHNFKYFLYTDTDSIFLMGNHASKFNFDIDPSALGKWKCEFKKGTGVIRRPKQYFLKGIKIKNNIEKKDSVKMAYAGINFNVLEILYDEKEKEIKRIIKETLKPIDFIAGKYVPEQLRPKRYFTGVLLIEQLIEIKPIWEFPPKEGQWFKNENEYKNKYKEQELLYNVNAGLLNSY